MEQWQIEMAGWYPEFQALRHQLHREPERSLQEYKTTQLIRELLAGWGAEVEEHPGLETGLTALIRGKTPGCPSPPAGRASVTPAATTSTPPPCSGPPRPCAPSGTGSTAQSS